MKKKKRWSFLISVTFIKLSLYLYSNIFKNCVSLHYQLTVNRNKYSIILMRQSSIFIFRFLPSDLSSLILLCKKQKDSRQIQFYLDSKACTSARSPVLVPTISEMNDTHTDCPSLTNSDWLGLLLPE